MNHDPEARGPFYPDEHEDSSLARNAGRSPQDQQNYEQHLHDVLDRRKHDAVEEGLRGYPKLLEFPSVGGQLRVEVTLGKPDGDEGESVIRIDGTDAGNLWFGDAMKTPDSPRAVTLRIAGEDEHQVLAKAFREIADLLDNA